MAEPARSSLDEFMLRLTAERDESQVTEGEVFWRDRYNWLLEHNYCLRPRYAPDWKPSWKDTGGSAISCEDGILPSHPAILDAIRQSDGTAVTLKRVEKSFHPEEASIGEFFSTSPRATDPRNHCVPVLEVLQDMSDENIYILVMPLLRLFDDPRFNTVGEVVEFCYQLIEGMHFMHENHVAHRDCSLMNIMMDSKMYPDLFHPIKTTMNRNFRGMAKHYTRTERPVKYYLIDFGLAKKYNPEDLPVKELPIRGGDKSVPEFKGDRYGQPSDPFAVDVYCVGNVIREAFLNRYSNLEIMESLVDDMVQDDPTKRPTMVDVSRRFSKIAEKLSSWSLRWRLVKRDHGILVRSLLGLYHAYRTASYTLRGLSARPRPKLSDS